MSELGDREIYSRFSRQFTRENPSIHVSVEVIPWAKRMEKMITASQGDYGPDAAYIGLDFLPRFVERDMIVPVDSYITEEERADYDEIALDGISYKGRLWLYPMDRSVVAAVYNKDLFAQCGLDPDKPPETWEELERDVRTMTRDTDGDGNIDHWGLAYILGGETLNMTFWPLLWQAGGHVLQADGKRVAFNGPEGEQALNFITRIFQAGCIPHSFLAYGANEFASGKVGYWLGIAPVQFMQLRRDAPNLHIGVGPVLKNKRRLSYSTIGSYCIFSNSKHPAETAKWLSFVTRPENMREYCKAIYRLPTRKSVGSLYNDDPDLHEFEVQAQYCRTDVKSYYARQIMGAVIPDMQLAVLGRETPKQALEKAAAKANRILERGQ
jgi:multiple sugar transport system substrate-binding protein